MDNPTLPSWSPDILAALPVRPLIAHAEGQWFVSPTGRTVNLRQRRTLAVLLQHLATQRVRAPGLPLAPDELIARLWHGEKLLLRAARNRLHVAVHTLRKMGFGDALLFDGTGYFIDPGVPFARVSDD